MRFFLIAMLLSTFLHNNALAQNAFKLGAAETTSQVKSSGKGIIGIRFEKDRYAVERPRILEIYPGTPAERAGVRPGDEIDAVDGIPVSRYSVNQIYSLLSGPPGSPVDLSIIARSQYGNRVRRNVRLNRMEMNTIPSDNIFRIYRYGY